MKEIVGYGIISVMFGYILSAFMLLCVFVIPCTAKKKDMPDYVLKVYNITAIVLAIAFYFIRPYIWY